MSSYGGAGDNSRHEAIATGWESAMEEVFENERAGRIIAAAVDSFVEVGTPEEQPEIPSGVPTAIIQAVSVDSTPLIRLESIESSNNNDDEEEAKNEVAAASPEEGNGWLDLADSSSSKGSQGSYADQVPELAGSGSAHDPYDLKGIETAEGKRPLTVDTSPYVSNVDAPFSPAGGASIFSNPTDEGSTVFSGFKNTGAKHTVDAMQSTAVHPILESTETMEDILGPNDNTFHTAMESVSPENRLTVITNEDVLQDMLSPKETFGSGVANDPIALEEPSLEQSQNQHQDEAMRQSEASQSDPSPEGKDLLSNNHEPTIDNTLGRIVESLATHQNSQPQQPARLLIGPKGSNISYSTYDESHLDHAPWVISEQGSSWSDSKLHPGSPSFSEECTSYSRSGGDSFSPTSRTRGSLFSGTSYSTHQQSASYVDTSHTMSHDESLTTAGYTTNTQYSDRSYTERSGTDRSVTGHTRTTGPLSDYYEESDAATRGHPKSKLTESLMARLRSRADPSALSPTSASAATERPTMVRIGEEQDEQFIVMTALARKRVSIVQLLIVGLFGALICIFASIWIQSSCHYVSAEVTVGESDEVFNLHYGLWKFTPIGSAFQDYKYCNRYEPDYAAGPPLLPRIASMFAILGGTYAVCVLWFYLIFGRGNRFTWNAAVSGAFIAGILHGVSLLILITPPCDEQECTLGPAGFVAIAASVANFILGFEMYYNSPIRSWMDDVPTCPSSEQPGQMMKSLEMADFQEGASAYCRRLIATPSEEIPTLNQIQRNNEDPLGEGMFGRDLAQGVYSPPPIV